MAKLPRSPISEGVTNQYRPVREARASGADPVGQAMEQAGNAGFEIASRMADAKIATDAANAEIGLRSDLDKLRRELEADSETAPEQLESVYRERASKMVADRAGAMQSPALRRAFGTQSAATLENGAIDMRDVTRRKQVSSANAEALKVFDAYEQSTKDPLSYQPSANGGPSLAELNRESAIGLIERRRRAGTLDEDTAMEQTLKARAVYDVGLSNAHVFTIDAYLEKGDAVSIALADAHFMEHSGDISQEQREKVRDVIDVKKNENLAITTADKLWGESNGNFDVFITKTREIANVNDRLAVEARGAQLKNQDEAARDAEQDAVVDEALIAITSGKSVSSSVMMRADGKTRLFIQDQVRQRRIQDQQMATLSAEEKAAIKEESATNRDYLTSFASSGPAAAEVFLAGPAVWKDVAPDLYKDYNALSVEDKNKINLDINTRRASGGTTTAADAVFADLVQAVPMLQPSKAVGVKYGDARSTTAIPANEEKAVRASLKRQSEDYARRTGGAPLTIDERDRIIARAFREVDGKLYPFTEPGIVVDPLKDRLRAVNETRSDLRDLLGREPTPKEIDAELKALGLK